MEKQVIRLSGIDLRERIDILSYDIQGKLSPANVYDLYGLSMVSRAWHLAMYTLSKEIFHIAKNKGRMVDGIKMDACKTI